MNIEITSEKVLGNIIIAAAGAAAIAAVTWYLTLDPVRYMVMRVPGMDGAARMKAEEAEEVNIGEHFAEYGGSAAELAGRWTGFRGPARDNTVAAGETLLDRLPENGLEPLWSVELGEGHAGAAVWDGRVYVLDYDEEARADALRCFSLADGQEIWRRWYQVTLKRNHGMSRTVPSVADGLAVTIGPKCHVMCVDAVTGELKWTLDMQEEYGVETPFWYTAQCPLVDDGTVVLAPAGPDVLMAGIDIYTGAVKWETPNPDGFQMSHASVMPMELDGEKMYVYSAVGGIAGVAADSGSIAWSSTEWDYSVVAPSPVILDDGRIFLTAGYGAGAMTIQVSSSDGEYSVDILDEYGPGQGLASEQHTPIVFQGHIFGVLPRDGGILKEQFVCYNINECRKPVWNSGKAKRFGLGPFILADGKFYIMDDSGRMTIIKASPDAYRELDSFRLFEGRNAWAPIAVAGELMLVRDSTRMFCFNMRKR
ncbi:MAG: PQQ-binding-like beta-propeller repeat protein [Verrucomicrobiota bacterium]